MKIKIKPKTEEPIEDLYEELLVEPDITNPHEFVRIRKDLWDKVIREFEFITETTEKDRSFCNAKGFFSLKDLLIRLNLIAKASKGNLSDK